MADHASHFLLVTILTLLTILLVFGMKYFSSARRAHAQMARDDRSGEMSARTLKAQEDSAAALASLRDDMAGLKARLLSVETMLKEVG